MNKSTAIARIGKRGTLVIPAEARRRYRLEENSLVTVEATEDGLLLRPVMVVPLETYSRQRKAELLLENAVDEADRAWAEEEVRKLGLNPADLRAEAQGKGGSQ